MTSTTGPRRPDATSLSPPDPAHELTVDDVRVLWCFVHGDIMNSANRSRLRAHHGWCERHSLSSRGRPSSPDEDASCTAAPACSNGWDLPWRSRADVATTGDDARKGTHHGTAAGHVLRGLGPGDPRLPR